MVVMTRQAAEERYQDTHKEISPSRDLTAQTHQKNDVEKSAGKMETTSTKWTTRYITTEEVLSTEASTTRNALRKRARAKVCEQQSAWQQLDLRGDDSNNGMMQ
jgi:hypothetical protein